MSLPFPVKAKSILTFDIAYSKAEPVAFNAGGTTNRIALKATAAREIYKEKCKEKDKETYTENIKSNVKRNRTRKIVRSIK